MNLIWKKNKSFYLHRTLLKTLNSTLQNLKNLKIWSIGIFQNLKNQILNYYIIEEKGGCVGFVNHPVHNIWKLVFVSVAAAAAVADAVAWRYNTSYGGGACPFFLEMATRKKKITSQTQTRNWFRWPIDQARDKLQIGFHTEYSIYNIPIYIYIICV